MGTALLIKGRFADAQASTQQALDLLPENDPLRPTVLHLRDKCDTWLRLEALVSPDVLAGKSKPKDTADRLGLAEFYRLQQRNAAAAQTAGNTVARARTMGRSAFMAVLPLTGRGCKRKRAAKGSSVV